MLHSYKDMGIQKRCIDATYHASGHTAHNTVIYNHAIPYIFCPHPFLLVWTLDEAMKTLFSLVPPTNTELSFILKQIICLLTSHGMCATPRNLHERGLNLNKRVEMNLPRYRDPFGIRYFLLEWFYVFRRNSWTHLVCVVKAVPKNCF